MFDRADELPMTDISRLGDAELRAIVEMRNSNLMEYIDDVRHENEQLRQLNPQLQVVCKQCRKWWARDRQSSMPGDHQQPLLTQFILSDQFIFIL